MNESRSAFGTSVRTYGSIDGTVPEVSCLMAAYLGDDPRLLSEALHSVGLQEGVDLELVLVLDGAVTKDTEAAVEAYCSTANHPVRIIQTEKNNGLAHALNEGLGYCRGDLVARFDADDVSDPMRLSEQLEFLNSNPNIDVLGTSLTLVNEVGETVREKHYPESHSAIRRSFFLRNPIAHPSVMFRRGKILELGGYPSFRKSQDYALWGVCLISGLHFANLPGTLVQMRIGERFAERRGRDYFRTESEVLNFLRQIGSITTVQYLIAFSLRYLSRQLNHFLTKAKRKQPV